MRHHALILKEPINSYIEKDRKRRGYRAPTQMLYKFHIIYG